METERKIAKQKINDFNSIMHHFRKTVAKLISWKNAR